MKVILKEDVKKLGTKNQVIEVSDGYARNFLFPKALAVEADGTNMRKLKEQTDLTAKKDQQAKEKAEDEKRRLQDRQVSVSVSSGEGGRLFGSVTTSQVADAIKKQFDINVDKKNVKMADAIKTLGSYPFTVRLYSSVEASI